MVLHVLLDLFAGQAFGIKAPARRHGRNADERPVLFDLIETRAVDPQIVAQLLVLRILAASQGLIEGQAFRIALPPVNILQIAGSIHQLGHQFLLPRGETGGMKRNLDAA